MIAAVPVSPRRTSSFRTAGPHLLAALLLVHVLTMTVVSLGPAPVGDEVADEGFFVQAGRAWNQVFSATRTTVRPVARHLGTVQHWRMFADTRTGTSRVEIAVRTGEGPWRAVYRQGSSDQDWNAEIFGYYRWREFMKGVVSVKRAGPFNRWVEWTAPRVLDAFPEADEARFRVMVGRIPPPDSERRGVRFGRVHRHRVIRRSP